MPTRAKVALFVVVSACRFVYSADRVAPELGPDEFATLGMGRWLAGGEWNMFRASTWRPGLAVLMVPLHALLDSETTIVRSGLVLNSLLGGLGAVLLAALATRLVELRGLSLWCTCAGLALAPAALSASAHLWAEPLVTVTFLAACILLVDYWGEPTALRGCLIVVVSSFGTLSHGRMLPAAVLATLGAVSIAVSRRLWPTALLVGGFGASMLIGVEGFCRWLFKAIYEVPGDQNSATGVLGRLNDPLAVLDSAVGQAWYLMTATVLTAGFGAMALLKRARSGPTTVKGRAALVVGGMTGAAFVVSAIFMSERGRADHVIYGRYNEAVMWPVAVAGIAWVSLRVRSVSLRQLATVLGSAIGLTIALGLLVQQLHYQQLRRQGAVPPMIPGLLPYLSVTGHIRPFLLALLASLIGGALVILVRGGHRRSASSIVILGLVACGAMSHRVGADTRDYFARSEGVEVVRRYIPRDAVVGYVFVGPDFALHPDPWQLNYALTYQWFLDGYAFATDGGLDDSIGPYVFSATNDIFLNLSGSEILWTDPMSEIALWREAPGVTMESLYELLQDCRDSWTDASKPAPQECERLVQFRPAE